ncbi:dipeptide ABC transporter ATP-binding protein [Microbacterium sp. No. 7]|uniref:dipeptide ABC transporter ATP-binding protein n=1 Tax=Microbacterium sp. No. 7 TaxID=1714373 RepID=UPI0006D03DBC|nr:ABC transporter ATP-binding protein [Microbacterium sp. No. 7]ALJ19305.1 ABC transporter ATP-binding protein [Microbacterium sp. No. 7]
MTHTANTAATGEVVLTVKDLAVDFETEMGVVHAIEDVSFELRRGEKLAIVGESGSGKSTTMNAVLGLMAGNGRIAQGEIRFNGRDLSRLGQRELQKIRGAEIGYIPQDPLSSLNPVLSIGDQLGEVMLVHGKATRRNVAERSVAALEAAGLSDARARLKQYPHEFSGGMRQRVLIGIGLSCDPQLLVADEPTSALDVTVQRQILDHLDRMTESLGTSMILITHDLGLAAERCERVIVMYRGRIVEQGDARQILTDPQHEYTRRLVRAAPSVAASRAEAAGEPGGAHADAAAEGDDVLLRVESLCKSFGRGAKRFDAVKDVSFTLPRARTLAIVGESGSGKSTTARMVLRLDHPDTGRISFSGKNIASLSGRELKAARRRMQPVFQDPYSSINPMASVADVLMEPLNVHGVGTRKQRQQRARDLLEMVSLPDGYLSRYSSELSGGQRQRIAIARSLALHPELIICDEPVSALDVLVQAQILDLLMELQRELGLSYLFISHDLAVVRLIADDVIVMRRGEIVEQGPTVALFDDPQHEYTRNLIDSIPGLGLGIG